MTATREVRWLTQGYPAEQGHEPRPPDAGAVGAGLRPTHAVPVVPRPPFFPPPPALSLGVLPGQRTCPTPTRTGEQCWDSMTSEWPSIRDRLERQNKYPASSTLENSTQSPEASEVHSHTLCHSLSHCPGGSSRATSQQNHQHSGSTSAGSVHTNQLVSVQQIQANSAQPNGRPPPPNPEGAPQCPA